MRVTVSPGGPRPPASHGTALRPFRCGVARAATVLPSGAALMGVVHIRAAYELTAGGPGLKGVLLAFADRACDECGLAWPGIKYLAEHAELGETKTREAIRILTERGFLSVHGFAKGGRGLSTEYIVLPHVAKLSTAPCGKCREMMKRHHTGVGFTGPEPVKPITRRRKSHHTGVDHPSVEPYPSGDAARRNSETDSPSARSARGTSEPHRGGMPVSVQQALEGLGLRSPEPPASEGNTASPRPSQGKDGSQTKD